MRCAIILHELDVRLKMRVLATVVVLTLFLGCKDRGDKSFSEVSPDGKFRADISAYRSDDRIALNAGIAVSVSQVDDPSILIAKIYNENTLQAERYFSGAQVVKVNWGTDLSSTEIIDVENNTVLLKRTVSVDEK